MSPAQTSLYFREWGAVRKHYTSQGIDPKLADAKRHELHRRALGNMKSSKDFTNADLDKVLGVFRAITWPADLDAQLRQIDQPVLRKSDLIERCRTLAERCVDRPGLEKFYLDGMAKRIFGMPHGHNQLNEVQLAKLKGILEQRHRQLDKAEGKQRPGALRHVAAENPF